jgi:Fe-S-cluster containining protein|nr:YkgJ family cysteine cluster protein [Kofleriaceae bacterium]
MSRAVTRRYIDPLTQVWVSAAHRIGLTVIRTADAYAATDGRGTLAIGGADALDADDSLAQMIFHELCHSLVEGPDSFTRADWGMDNTGPDHDWREHACLRAQWLLAGRYGLRGVFAPTTDFRAFWDTLAGTDVLADREDRSTIAAIAAVQRAGEPPWSPALLDALAATARIAAAAAPAARADAAASGNDASLWSLVEPARAAHPTGLPAGEVAGTCGGCAWRYTFRGGARCRQAEVRVDPAWTACERYEAAGSVDCLTCGACCREAYQAVELTRRDPCARAHPELIVDHGTYLELARRPGPTGDRDRCMALHGGEVQGTRVARYHCTIYEDRPRTCRDFTLGSEHCLTARQRVGLSL